jgi:hypothetical protein
MRRLEMEVQSNGKVRRTSSEWDAIFEAYESSGLSESAFCRRRKISKSTFSKWKQRRANRRRKPAVRRTSSPDFVEWAQPTVTKVPPEVGAGEFELSLPGGIVLRWKP